MEQYIRDLMKKFSGSFINGYNEFIANSEFNVYFRLDDCENELDIKCKILEWFSRPICKGNLCIEYFDFSMYEEGFKFNRDDYDFYWVDQFEISDGEFIGEICKHINYYSKSKCEHIIEVSKRFQKGCADYLGMTFTFEEWKTIYCRLGNCVNHNLTVEFVKSGYDFGLLSEK